MCIMCMILSSNCYAVIIFEYRVYSSTKFIVTLLPSCLSGCFAKQMVECRFRPSKTSEEEEKCVVRAIAR